MSVKPNYLSRVDEKEFTEFDQQVNILTSEYVNKWNIFNC